MDASLAMVRVRPHYPFSEVHRHLPNSTSMHSLSLLICFSKIVMGKVEEDPSYMKYSENYLPWHGHVTALTVAPQYRRLGIAKLLTQALERGCEEHDAWFVDLFVRQSNDTGIRLYKGMG